MATGDPTIRQDLKKDGYSQEEKYFHERDRELIEAHLLESQPLSHEEDDFSDSPTPPPTPPRRIIRFLKKIFGIREGSQDLF